MQAQKIAAGLRVWVCWVMGFVLGAGFAGEAAGSGPLVAPPVRSDTVLKGGPPWRSDYGQALRQAVAERKMLFIFFVDPAEKAAADRFLQNVVPRVVKQADLRRYVWVRLPLEAEYAENGNKGRLLEHQAFEHMYGRQGVAIVDFTRPDAPYYGRVVSCFPFDRGKLLTDWALRIVLDLPPGTLTQRTMIYAVRVHPERPASTEGRLSPILMEEAQKHSRYQAQIQVQGHHNWDARFHRINARLGGGLTCQEVVAESWAGMELVKAARDCVHAWRQSSGHWSAVRRRHRLFGYDMWRGKNGVWYATGLFAD